MNTNKITRRRLLGLGASSLATVAVLAGCGAGAATPAAASPKQPGTSPAGNGTPTNEVTLHVFGGEAGIKGPDGKGHDAFVPASFVLKAGTPVHLIAINHDDMPHTITQPTLGLNIMVNPGKAAGNAVQPVTTTATFTVQKVGVYRWYCSLACDGSAGGWAMTNANGSQSQDGFMAGNIVAI